MTLIDTLSFCLDTTLVLISSFCREGLGLVGLGRVVVVVVGRGVVGI